MTNAEIILKNSIELMKNGIIGNDGSGRTLKYQYDDGHIETLPFPEEIHTFAMWKDLGMCVQKGQKAIAKFDIWKYTKKAIKNENGEPEYNEDGTPAEKENMFRQTVAFFSRSQVAPIDPEKEKKIQAAKEAKKNRKGKKSKDNNIKAAPLLLPAHVEPEAAPAAELAESPAPSKEKKPSKTEINAATKRISKAGTNDDLRGQWQGKDNKYYVCSGYHMIRTHTKSELPMISKSAKTEQAELFFNKHNARKNNDLTLPTITELKSIIKEYKQNKIDKTKWLYKFGENKPIVNAQFLLDILTALNGSNNVLAHESGKLQPIFFTAPTGDGMLMPIRAA